MGKAEKPKESWQERRKKIRHRWAAPFVYVEWRCEQLSYALERWAFLDILGHAGRFAILVGIIFYFAESGSRRKAKHYQAWQVINSAQGKIGSGGRVDALHDLCGDGVSLVGVNISMAHLPKLNLENANLRCATVRQSTLDDANLGGAILFHADLTLTSLRRANLVGADLGFAKLAKVNLAYADLEDANLVEASLTGANLAQVDLKGANLARADLCCADLWHADLTTIKSWPKIKSIELANVYGVKNAPDGFIEWAIANGAVSIAIDDYEEWRKLRREKMEEKRKQQAENSRRNQKEAGER